MEIIWSRSAKETLATVLDYIEEYFDSTVAMKVYNKINNHVDLLVSFPRMGVRIAHKSTRIARGTKRPFMAWL